MDSFPVIADMVKEAENHAEALSKSRKRAIEYDQGEMKDTPSDPGRSEMVTRDVRSARRDVLPSIVRTILGADEVAEFTPVDEGDEQGAEQATDYINYVVLPESDGATAIRHAIEDACLLRNGILKWWYEEKQCVKISTHTGLTDIAYGQLAGDDDVEVVEHSEYVEQIDTGQGPADVPLHDCKLRRKYTEKGIKAAAVPRDRFLIHPDAVTLEDSLLTGEKTRERRSNLIAMGHDRKMVESLSLADDEDDEADARKEFFEEGQENAKANQLVDYYDLFVRIDMDDDGIAELRHMCFAGGLKRENLLLDEEVDDVQFCDIKISEQPHQWEGVSIADDMMDVQRVKTVLLRQTLDNLYWQNNPQPIFQEGAVKNPDAVYNPEFGKPIRTREGVSVRDAYAFNNVPFVASESFGMLEYMDREGEKRTGISDASAGMPPDALQNVTAKASAMMEQQGIGQTELIVKTVAKGLEAFFRGLLRLAIRHQDVPRTVRLRDEWVDFDPRHWNAEMDCKVNTGLGAGTRERDMQMMNAILGVQERILAGFGPDNPFVKPDNLSNTLNKLTESSGLRTPSLYFTTPDPEEVAQRLEAAKNQPDPEKVKLDAQMQLEKLKIQVNRDKEDAQMQADLTVKQAEIQASSKAQAEKLASDATLQAQKIAFEREKWEGEMVLRREEAQTRRQDEIWKAQAAAFETAAE